MRSTSASAPAMASTRPSVVVTTAAPSKKPATARRARRARRRRARSARARGAPRPRARAAPPAARRSARGPAPGRPGRSGGASRSTAGPRPRSRRRWQGLCVPGSIVGNNDHPVTVDPSIASPHAPGPARVATRAARGRLDAGGRGRAGRAGRRDGRRRAPVRAVPVACAGRCSRSSPRMPSPLPTAVRLAVAVGLRAVGRRAGDVVRVGGGAWRCPGSTSWPPAPGAPPASAAPLPRAGCSSGRRGSHLQHPARGRSRRGRDGRAGGSPTASAPPARQLCVLGWRRTTTCALATRGAVAGLVGRGPGLTPSGDDALAGALLVAHALGTGAALADAVRARLGATTAVSAALLDAAADGYAARPVVALVDAAIAGRRGCRAPRPARRARHRPHLGCRHGHRHPRGPGLLTLR